MTTVDLGLYLPAHQISEADRLLVAIKQNRTLGLSVSQREILTKLLPTGLFERDGDTFRWKS